MYFWFHKGAWASKRAQAEVAGLEPAKIAKIAVIRHAALGDMVLTRPFLVELRRFFPNAEITLSLVSNYIRGAPEDLADRVHIVFGSDRRDITRREQIKRIKELGEQDLIFDLAATSRSYWLCRLTTARLKIGFPYKALLRRLVYDVAVYRSDLRCETDNMLDMINLFGFKTSYPPQFSMPGDALVRERPYIVYFTSASTSYKCWPDDHFTGLIGRLADNDADYDHIVLQGVADWESIDDIMKPLEARTNVQAMRLESVEETVSLLKGAAMLVSNDTGIRHLGVASETPTLGIFFITAPFKSTPFRYWPRYGGHDVVFNADGSMPDVDAVYQAARSILGDNQKTRSNRVA